MSEIMSDEEINKIYSEVECSGRMQYGGHMMPLINHGLAANLRIRELEKKIAVRDIAIETAYNKYNTTIFSDPINWINEARAELEGEDGKRR